MDLEKGRSARASANGKTSAREKLLKGWTDSWANKHANSRWTVRIWDRISMEELAEREFAGVFYGLFARLEDSRDRDRLSRYLALLHEGGVIVAPTVECLKPLDSLVVQAGIVLVEDKQSGLISPDFIASPPWHPLWWMVLHEIKRRVMAIPIKSAGSKTNEDEDENNETNAAATPVEDLTGDRMLTDVVNLYLELYPDTAIKIMGASDDMSTADVIAKGKPEQDGLSSCTERSDCESEFPRAFAIRHIVSSLLDERIVGDSKAEL